MKQFAKLVNNILEFAPESKDGIINYNLDEDLMKADGYKEYVETEPPAYPAEVYYEETDTQIIQRYRAIPIPEPTPEELEKSFKEQFLVTSYGGFRLQPHGFANALQALDFIDRKVDAYGLLPPQIGASVIFYQIPDFTKPEQCTEEWLIAHQVTFADGRTKEEWKACYDEVSLLYLQLQYKSDV